MCEGTEEAIFEYVERDNHYSVKTGHLPLLCPVFYSTPKRID